jgi:hypothetical protein
MTLPDYEVRMKLSDGKAYVNDLDVQVMRQVDTFHNSTEEEKGPWVADDLKRMDLRSGSYCSPLCRKHVRELNANSEMCPFWNK